MGKNSQLLWCLDEVQGKFMIHDTTEVIEKK